MTGYTSVGAALRRACPEVVWEVEFYGDRDGVVLVGTFRGREARRTILPRLMMLEGDWWREVFEEPVRSMVEELGVLAPAESVEQKLRAYSGARGWTPETGDEG